MVASIYSLGSTARTLPLTTGGKAAGVRIGGRDRRHWLHPAKNGQWITRNQRREPAIRGKQ
jgi:hypothetical protein